MPERAVPIQSAYRTRTRRLSVDDAVRAVLQYRQGEPRAFGNEDDVEGGRPSTPQMTQATPSP